MSPTYILTQEEDGSLSAILSGNAGATDLLVSPGARTYNLLEFTNGGIVNVTTLQPNETLTSAKAVHSRHVVLPMLDMWMPVVWRLPNNAMKHLTLLILLVLAVFGYGDDLVLYCVRTEHAHISPQTAYTYNKFADGYKHVQITLKITDEKVDLKSPNNWLDGKQFIVLDTKGNYIPLKKLTMALKTLSG